MAETESKVAASQSVEQPQLTNTVAMSEVDKKIAETTPEPLSPTDIGEPSLPIPVPAKDTPPTDETESSSKGKDKEEQTSIQAEKPRDESDSLSIGPSDAAPQGPTSDPVCSITLLLPTGARHPYRIDERYLAKRNVEVPDVTESGKKDPFSISIYKLKELILREWRDEWEGKPASPSSIRLIHFGKLLDDKEQLKKYQFSQDSPNVVHMSVRPAEMMEEDEAGKGKSSTREHRRSDGGNGCCVIL
ncbi:Ubiquitin-related domain containing protein [Rhypophila decipiens]